MRELPVLFSIMMVQANMEDRKGMTRRMFKPQPIIDEAGGRVFDGAEPVRRSPFDIHNWKVPYTEQFCHYKVGDVLWVREMLYQNGELGLKYVADNEWIDERIIPNDHKPYRNYAFCNIPSIHMPKWAARIWLKVTEVRIERLKDISEEDAIAEGVERLTEYTILADETQEAFWKCYLNEGEFYRTAYESFQSLWIKINGADSWSANPWVWVIKYKVLSKTGKPQ